MLRLILLPTEQCNFRCTYCYEAFEIGKMSQGIQEAVCRLIEGRDDLRYLQLSWFGGEPLAAFDVVKRIGGFAHEHCERNGIAYNADMTTNGYLLDGERAATLLDQKVESYRISLDGDREAHDRTRIRANGRGSFDRILKNIEAIVQIDREFRIMLRIHYHRENLESIPGLVERLGRTFGREDRITLFFRNISRFGGPNDAALPIVEDKEKRQAIEKTFEEQAKTWFTNLYSNETAAG